MTDSLLSSFGNLTVKSASEWSSTLVQDAPALADLVSKLTSHFAAGEDKYILLDTEGCEIGTTGGSLELIQVGIPSTSGKYKVDVYLSQTCSYWHSFSILENLGRS